MLLRRTASTHKAHDHPSPQASQKHTNLLLIFSRFLIASLVRADSFVVLGLSGVTVTGFVNSVHLQDAKEEKQSVSRARFTNQAKLTLLLFANTCAQHCAPT